MLLRASLPAGLYDELSALTPDVADGSLQELVLAHAEIIGWLQGLFQAIQLAMTQAGMCSRRTGPTTSPSVRTLVTSDGDPLESTWPALYRLLHQALHSMASASPSTRSSSPTSSRRWAARWERTALGSGRISQPDSLPW